MSRARSHVPLVAALVVTSAYAVLRYNVLKGVPWEHLPLYVINKSVAWTSVTLVLVAALQALKGYSESAARNVSSGYTLAGLHVLMSLVLLSPARYPELFDPGQQLTAIGGLTALSGVLGVAGAFGARGNRLGPVFFSLAIATHCTLLGARGWFTPSKWPGYMVPITLLSALTALVAAILSILALRKMGDAGR